MTHSSRSSVPVQIIDNEKEAGYTNTDSEGNFTFKLILADSGSHKILASTGTEHSTPWTISRTVHKDVVQDFEIYANGPYPSGLDTKYIIFTGISDNQFLELVPKYPAGETPPRSLSVTLDSVLTMKNTTQSITIAYSDEGTLGHTWQCRYKTEEGIEAVDEQIIQGSRGWTTITFTHPNIVSATLIPRTGLAMHIHKCLMTVDSI
ncbi:hypothetical protein [Pseudomonas sp. efr-133-TYG-103a]|uniref:hypothetical protein n=1 Tax=Pseudomonas sp. efr-133-TYG-103a TaxID=3040308 RepID=UPI002555F57B|nr:hypothetical protein [Pseudomonas sp. efr-133-TYG-103a]